MMESRCSTGQSLVWICLFGLGLALLGCGQRGDAIRPAERPWHNPKIRPWKDYPFIERPKNTLHTELWRDFDNLPDWAQRGRIVYGHISRLSPRTDRTEKQWQAFQEAARKAKQDGVSLLHIHSPPSVSKRMAQFMDEHGPAPIIRLDGKHFFGNYDIWRISQVRGGVSRATGFVPNHDWYRKFPPSLAANAVMRDGQLAFEYYGSPATQRRTLNFMHPISLQVRDAFLREGLLGEQVFDIPIDSEVGGHLGGVWYDNPNNQLPSFDAYSREYTARRFREAFGKRYRQKYRKEFNGSTTWDAWVARRMRDRRFVEKYPTGQSREALFDEMYEKNVATWYSDPPYFYIKYKHQDVMDWWEDLWAEAHATYWAWQYKFVQEEIAPKMGKKHMFVGGNFKLCTPRAAWDYYAFSWEIADILGPGESSLFYSDKQAPGYKMALAASNGKPGGLWRSTDRQRAEAMACLGVVVYQVQRDVDFLRINRDLFHNAKPGGRVAYLYHLEDGLHHNEVANMCRLTDQIWRAGVPFETITERHLSPQVLKNFDVVVVPGFKFTARDVNGLKNYLAAGGKLLMIGDNRDPNGKPLVETLAGLEPRVDGDRAVGKGEVRHFATQLVTQQQMNGALEALGATDAYRLISPAGANVLINVIAQPSKALTSVHLVNFTNAPLRGIVVTLPADLKARHAAVISPYGGAKAVAVKDNTVSLDKLSLYSVIVVCPDAKTRDAIVARNKAAGFKPHDGKYKRLQLRGNIPARQVKLADLKPGEKLCHLRETARCNIHRIDADIVTGGVAAVGRPHPIKMRIHRIGVHSPARVQVDKVAFVAVHEETGERETVHVVMDAPADGKGLVPAATVLRADTVTNWTPKKPGHYQLYLSYRYVSQDFEGRPDSTKTEKWRRRGKQSLDDYFWSVPLLKMVYEDRLPGLTVEVKAR